MDLEKFWSNINVVEECWLWKGAKFSEGYGHVRIDKKDYETHRLAWEITYGSIPDGICVLHHCDIPSCIRPAHLFLGTKADNSLDMMLKGRNASHFGSENGNARLNEDLVIEIRNIPDDIKHVTIAKVYGVTPECISNIRRRKTWTNV